jgi:hypothetical protein
MTKRCLDRGRLLDALDLLLQLRGGPALGGLHVLLPDEFLERDGEGLGDLRQQRDRHAPAADLVGGDHLLGEPRVRRAAPG